MRDANCSWEALLRRDPCEWDPVENRALLDKEKGHAPADFIVGANGNWRLCRACAELPEFAKYRKRSEVRR